MDEDQDLDTIIAAIDAEEDVKKEQNNGGGEADPTPASGLEEATAQGQDKTSEKVEGELDESQAITPPHSWPSEDKEAFKSLPSWAQERIVTRENEREAQFAERSRTIAARERDLNDRQMQTSQAQQQYAQGLEQLTQLAMQIMPEKFSDIRSETDFLRVKMEDPARANEFEVFQRLLSDARQKQQLTAKQSEQQHLDREFSLLQQKFPEFQNPEKAASLMGDVRKAAVEHYNFTPDEVAVIADHRYVPIIRDAMAWRSHQANLKAAAGKKVPAAPVATVRPNAAASGASLDADARSKILGRAAKETDLYAKAELIASLFN